MSKPIITPLPKYLGISTQKNRDTLIHTEDAVELKQDAYHIHQNMKLKVTGHYIMSPQGPHPTGLRPH